MRAGNAGRRGWIEVEPCPGDILATVLTIAELTVLDANERSVDPLPPCGPAALVRFGHGLALKGVHSAEAAHGLLIEHDRAAIFRAFGVAFVQRRTLCKKSFAIGVYLSGVQHR